MRKPNIQEQANIVKYVESNYSSFDMQLKQRKARMLDVYETVSSFRGTKGAKRQTDFKVNKAFEVENKVLPRIIANNPKRLVSLNTDEFDEGDRGLSPEERAEKIKEVSVYAHAIRDYLTNVFNKQDLTEVVKLRAKSGVRYGLSRAKVCYRYDYGFESYKEEVTEYDEEGNEIKSIEGKTKQKIVSEYPSIDNVSRSDIVFDPRYIRLEDSPGMIETKEGIRMSYFTKNPKKYLNVDKLIELANLDHEDEEGYKSQIQAITGINNVGTTRIDMNSLTVKKFYGWYEFGDENGKKTGREEKLYEFWTVSDLLLVYAKEISQLPFQDMKCFEDTESMLAVGFIEPIISLQEELNFKKNSASQYINQSLNRNWIRSAQSGINPKHLNSKPGNIIPTTRDGQTAMANIQELPFRQLPPAYFQEQNDFERQIQGATFTVDTASPQGNQALTNTATGIKIKAFESNSVIDMVRKNYENSLSMLAYKFLNATFDNLDDNAIIKSTDDESYWEINKEAMRDAVRRYSIKVEAGSTSFDTEEQRRSNAIAKSNISSQFAQQGVPVNLTKVYKDVMQTFEGTDPDEYIKPIDPMAMQQEQPQGGGTAKIPMPQTTTSPGDIPL